MSQCHWEGEEEGHSMASKIVRDDEDNSKVMIYILMET